MKIPLVKRSCARAWLVQDDQFVRPVTAWKDNLLLYDWASIIAKLLATADSSYRVSMMYLEFKNVASPGDTVTAPSYTRADGISYYNSLASSLDTDYLRVKLQAAIVESTDAELYPEGNLIRWLARTSGVEGVHGKEFSDVVNSTIYGGALVAARSQADPTQDLLLSRFYFDPADQQLKLATSQVGVEWETEYQ